MLAIAFANLLNFRGDVHITIGRQIGEQMVFDLEAQVARQQVQILPPRRLDEPRT